MSGPNILNLVAPMTSSDLVKVIKACNDAHVTYLKIGELSISFLDNNLTNGAKCPETIIRSEPDISPAMGNLSKEEELDLLILADSKAYEELVPTE
jgi:hypothetical protein